MTTRFFIVLCLLGCLALPLHAATRKSPEPKAKPPVLKVDASPVTDAPGGLVASYADVVEPVQRAVVSVAATKSVRGRAPVNPLLRQFFGDIPERESERKEGGLGSGVIVSPDGYILTNNHVVEGADDLKVTLSDDREVTATLIGTDPKTDIAVIKIEGENFPCVTLADSDKLRVGDVVFAVGNPLGVGQTVTMGIVSAKGRQVGILDEVGGYESFIQTDAAINMGNSGGALVDAKGRLVGINSAIISPSRGNIGIGFAVPVNLAAFVMHGLIATGTIHRGYLGVTSQDLTPDDAENLGLPRTTKGLTILEVVPDSAADKAGLQTGDVILSVDEKPIGSLRELRLTIAEMAPGTTVKLKIARQGKERVVDVTLGQQQEASDELLAGVEATPLTAELRTTLRIPERIEGLVVTTVASDSPYAGQLVPNLVIVQIDRENVADLESARRILQPGRHMLFVYYRGALRVVRLEVTE